MTRHTLLIMVLVALVGASFLHGCLQDQTLVSSEAAAL